MGITKRQLKYTDKGVRLPPEYRLYEIDGEIWIEKLRNGMSLLEYVAWKNKQTAKKKLKMV